MIEELQNIQFKIIKARAKRKELRDKIHELFITYSYLEMQEKTEETKQILDKILSESKTTAEEYIQADNTVSNLEQELYTLIEEGETRGVKYEIVLDPGWVYVITDVGVEKLKTMEQEE